MRLKKRGHAVDVSHPLPGDQQALQILGITRRLAACFIGHGETPPTLGSKAFDPAPSFVGR
jgi:hypothetical protein